MLFKTFGSISSPTIVLIHGGGLSCWMWQKQIDALKTRYHIVTPIIDGHGEDSALDFISIRRCTEQVSCYIRTHLHGNVKAIAGLSIGAQIVCDILSCHPDITEYAIIESALVCPIPMIRVLGVPLMRASYPLIKKRWFARLQAGQLCLPPFLFESYYHDTALLSKQSLVNITLSNAAFRLNPIITKTSAKVLVLSGAREPAIIRRSAALLGSALPDAKVMILPGMRHGALSLRYPEKYIQILNDFLAQS